MYLLYLRIYKNGRTKACMISYDHYMWLFVITTGYALGVNAGLALKHENAEGKRGDAGADGSTLAAESSLDRDDVVRFLQ